MNPKVLVTDPVHEAGLKILAEQGFRIEIRTDLHDPERLAREIEDYDVLIVRSRTKVTGKVIEAASNLKIIGRAGSGLDNIDLEAAKKRGIIVLNTPDALKISVAELTIGLMIAAARIIGYRYALLREGGWEKKALGIELYGKTLGVIGFGRIGREVAKRALALGMNVVAYDVLDLSEAAKSMGVRFTQDLYKVLAESDVVTIHVPLTPATRGMIGKREIESMKDGAILVNTSRGEIVDYKAVLEALNKGKLFAAAFDVYPEEPPRSPWLMELIRHPRVIATPHIGAQTVEAQRRVSIELAKKIVDAYRSYINAKTA